MATTILTVIHILAAIGIIGTVLIQHGKGADAGAAFGAGAAGGASGSVFGAQGSSNFLSRSTAVLATTFFVTSLSLAYLSKGPEEPTSVLDQAQQQQTEQAPAADEVPAVPPLDSAPANPQDSQKADVPDSPQGGMAEGNNSGAGTGGSDTAGQSAPGTPQDVPTAPGGSQ